MSFFFFLFILLLLSRLEVTFDEAISGVAMDLDSNGFKVLSNATKEVLGVVKPFSLTGSLPLIRELKVKHIFIITLFSFCYYARFRFRLRRLLRLRFVLIFLLLLLCRMMGMMFRL